VAVPKRRMSRSNTRSRRSQWKASAPAYATCGRCKQAKLPHVACPTCGYYNDRQVVDVG
jgi:large subunit ribosomal protein L32